MRATTETAINEIRAALSDLWDISVIYTTPAELVIQGQPRQSLELDGVTTRARLAALGYQVLIEPHPDQTLLILRRTEATAARRIPWVNIILFFATLLTTSLMKPLTQPGVSLSDRPRLILEWLPYSGALLTILVCHEFGHYFMSKARGVQTSLPYFLPAPTLFGTFGAFIKSKSYFRNRSDLLAIGAAGPIAGFIVALPVLFIGLSQAKIVPAGGGGMNFGESLLTWAIASITHGPLPKGTALEAGPLLLAGWVGVLVTMMNLLPLGQLDGGHILYGLLGKKQVTIARWAFLALLPLGLLWSGWWFWGALALVFRLRHPPTLDDTAPLDFPHKLMAFACGLIFILCFIPVPFS